MTGQAETDDVRWGLGDAALGFLLANVLAIFLAPVAYWATGQSLDTDASRVPLSTVALMQVPYSGFMLAAALVASRRKGHGPIADFRIRMRWLDIPFGLVIGVVTQYAAALLYVPLIRWTSVTTQELEKPARELTDRAHGGGVLLLVVMVVVVAPVAEELFFRGLVLRSLERRMSTQVGHRRLERALRRRALRAAPVPRVVRVRAGRGGSRHQVRAPRARAFGRTWPSTPWP